ncbi:MAG: hypothetical protein LBR58_11115 [Propionibacteriaceae bacterium]|nr:hypothetical protein [Propionibacteriaceae bacterium]
MDDLYVEEEIDALGDRLVEVAEDIWAVADTSLPMTGEDDGSQYAAEFVDFVQEATAALASLLGGLGYGAKAAYDLLSLADSDAAAAMEQLDDLFPYVEPEPARHSPRATWLDADDNAPTPSSTNPRSPSARQGGTG